MLPTPSLAAGVVVADAVAVASIMVAEGQRPAPARKQFVSNVDNMKEAFYATGAFNQDISGWDVSNVRVMTKMFYNAQAFYQDLSGWDVSNVTQYSNFGTDASEDSDWPPSLWPNF